jgi:acyl carrier protein
MGGTLSEHAELVLSLLEKWVDVPPGGIRPEHRLVRDLKIDGDDYGMSLVPEIKKRLGINPKRQEWEVITTVGQLLDMVERHVALKGTGGGAASA